MFRHLLLLHIFHLVHLLQSIDLKVLVWYIRLCSLATNAATLASLFVFKRVPSFVGPQVSPQLVSPQLQLLYDSLLQDLRITLSFLA